MINTTYLCIYIYMCINIYIYIHISIYIYVSIYIYIYILKTISKTGSRGFCVPTWRLGRPHLKVSLIGVSRASWRMKTMMLTKIILLPFHKERPVRKTVFFNRFFYINIYINIYLYRYSYKFWYILIFFNIIFNFLEKSS